MFRLRESREKKKKEKKEISYQSWNLWPSYIFERIALLFSGIQQFFDTFVMHFYTKNVV